MRIVVTAGPTREPIDPVRFLSNRSSGKMGYAIAEAAIEAGHEVMLISGPVNLRAPEKVQFKSIASYSRDKIKKRADMFSLELMPTRDILTTVADQDRSFLVVGFAAETENIAANARKKLREKKCDAIVANDVSRANTGMESDENEVTIFLQNGEEKKISRAPKKIIARELIKIISEMREKRLTKKT